MLFFIYQAWANEPWLLAVFAAISVILLAWLGIYLWQAYLGPQGYHQNPIIGQLGQIVVWEPHDKRLKIKDVFWQVNTSQPNTTFKVGDWAQVVAQDNLVLIITPHQPTE